MEFGNVVFEEMEKSEYQEKTPRIKGVHQLSTPYIPPPVSSNNSNNYCLLKLSCRKKTELIMLVKISKCKKVICPLCANGNRLIKQIEFVCVFP